MSSYVDEMTESDLWAIQGEILPMTFNALMCRIQSRADPSKPESEQPECEEKTTGHEGTEYVAKAGDSPSTAIGVDSEKTMKSTPVDNKIQDKGGSDGASEFASSSAGRAFRRRLKTDDVSPKKTRRSSPTRPNVKP